MTVPSQTTLQLGITSQTSLAAQTQNSHTVTALFDTKEAASAAVDELIQAGIPRSSISLVSARHRRCRWRGKRGGGRA